MVQVGWAAGDHGPAAGASAAGKAERGGFGPVSAPGCRAPISSGQGQNRTPAAARGQAGLAAAPVSRLGRFPARRVPLLAPPSATGPRVGAGGMAVGDRRRLALDVVAASRERQSRRGRTAAAPGYAFVATRPRRAPPPPARPLARPARGPRSCRRFRRRSPRPREGFHDRARRPAHRAATPWRRRAAEVAGCSSAARRR